MSQLPLCPHCLEPVRSGYHGSCPNCGKSLENHNPEGALPLGTQLGGHYTVGEYQSADGDGLCYRGVDNDERRFVLIKEYFPVTLCNGRSPAFICAYYNMISTVKLSKNNKISIGSTENNAL